MVLWSGPSRSWGPAEPGRVAPERLAGGPHQDTISIQIIFLFQSLSDPIPLYFPLLPPFFMSPQHFSSLTPFYPELVSWDSVSGKQTKKCGFWIPIHFNKYLFSMPNSLSSTTLAAVAESKCITPSFVALHALMTFLTASLNVYATQWHAFTKRVMS